jgi:hypothetical protein
MTRGPNQNCNPDRLQQEEWMRLHLALKCRRRSYRQQLPELAHKVSLNSSQWCSWRLARLLPHCRVRAHRALPVGLAHTPSRRGV